MTDAPFEPRTFWLLRRLARRRPGLFASHSGIVLSGAYLIPFLPGLVVQALLDRLSAPAPVGLGSATLLWLFALVAVVRTINDLLQPVAYRTMSVHAEVLLRRNMLDRVLHRPGARPLPSSAGEALVRFQADPQVVSHALDYLVDPLGQVIGFSFALAVLLATNATITLVVVIPSLLVMAVARIASPRVLEARRRKQDAHGRVSELLGDAFSTVVSIQAAGAEERIANHLDSLNEHRRRTTLRDLLVTEALTSIGVNAAAVAIGVVLLLASSGSPATRLSAGDLVLFATYLPWLAVITGFLGTYFAVMRQADVSIERMAAVAQDGAGALVEEHPTHLRGQISAPAVPRRRTAGDGLDVLRLEGLTFCHDSTDRGAVDIDLEVRRGQLVVVTGAIGSGKTTLLRTLLGLLPAQAGTITWNGVAVHDPAGWFVPPRAAYTAQVPRLFSMTLRENVLLGVAADEDELTEAAAAAVLNDDLVELPDGWDTAVGPRGIRLSGGQVQRTAAARMFVRDAALLVVDDLSSALDVVTEQRLWDRLLTRPSATCIAVSHRPAVLARADLVVKLVDGRRV